MVDVGEQRGMMSARTVLWAGCLALAMTFVTSHLAQADACTQDSFEGSSYIVCTIDPTSSDLRLFWQDSTGTPYQSFGNLSRSVEAEGKRLIFAMNAGMYRTDFTPVGLYIENGKKTRPIDTTTINKPAREVPNFYKKPNGIFFFDRKEAHILTTEEYMEQKPTARFATQSGPMLVIHGGLHPAFIPDSTDRTRRSGVGVCEDGHVRFAISEARISFHEFARLFRDHLTCPDALFLDGGHGTGIYSPTLKRDDVSWHGGYGPIFGLVN